MTEAEQNAKIDMLQNRIAGDKEKMAARCANISKYLSMGCIDVAKRDFDIAALCARHIKQNKERLEELLANKEGELLCYILIKD